MSVNFRQRARDALARAKSELAHGASERLAYAALELRMAIECVTYERAKAYEKELPPRDYDVWQPGRLMKELLELNPLADASGTLSIGLEEQPGVPAKEMKTLGTERVFNMKDIEDSYNALGSYLHQPTMRQLNSGKDRNWQRMRSRCDELVLKLEAVLSSSVFNLTLGSFATFKCLNLDCGKDVRKRVPGGRTEVPAPCFDCGAEHILSVGADGKCSVRAVVQDVHCAKNECQHVLKLFPHELKEGTGWMCPDCGTACVLSLAVFQAPSTSQHT